MFIHYRYHYHWNRLCIIAAYMCVCGGRHCYYFLNIHIIASTKNTIFLIIYDFIKEQLTIQWGNFFSYEKILLKNVFIMSITMDPD